MRIVFTWQPKEWRELYLLTTTEPRRRGASAPSMSYFVVALMALGGVGDVVHTLRTSRGAGFHGTLLPALLGVALLLGAVLLIVHLRRGRKRLRNLPPLPPGEQQLVLQETGWRAGIVEDADAAVHPWRELQGQRLGETVLALITRDGQIAGVPLRAMDEEQGSSVHRLLVRKLAPPVRSSET